MLRKLTVAVSSTDARGVDSPADDYICTVCILQVTTLSFRLAPANWPSWLIETIMRLSGSGCSGTGVYEFLVTAIEEIGRADLVGSRR